MNIGPKRSEGDFLAGLRGVMITSCALFGFEAGKFPVALPTPFWRSLTTVHLSHPHIAL